ncbi:HpcH/HpaI aldolase family protein [Sphingomonas profundi]|uniref:HpcH/HpaI aldolase family protein n=1 Tax=Alterirhizorhabdus profundi TaxID=2681549 RepID=UPI0012E83BE0|nr:aldolase/citrate lyase family protein [Sphingomonas profundi]
MTKRFGSFREQLAARLPLLGSFIKTPSVHAIEILGGIGFDFVIVDEEHGPFDRGTIDLLMLATRASQIAGMVRVAGPASILAALDMGADGILVPHVDSAADARAVAAAARFRGGTRGCSPSPRSGDYGAVGLHDYVARADAGVSVAVMIEHPDALENVEAIAAVDGIDALFLGLGDLAVAMGEPFPAQHVLRAAAEKVCRAADAQGKAVMATAPSVAAGAWLLDLGVTAFVVGSDQGLMRTAAVAELGAFRAVEQAGGRG